MSSEQRKYAWNYFQLHASQRMTTFNFFIILAALMTTGLTTTFSSTYKYHLIGIVLGLALSILSFVFWKLDQRVCFLIKHAEEVLKNLERTWKEQNDDGEFHARLFLAEEEKTMGFGKGLQLWRLHLSYSDCFGIVYTLFGAFGLFSAVFNFLR